MNLTKTSWNVILRISVLNVFLGFLIVSCSDNSDKLIVDNGLMFSTTNNDWESGQAKRKVEYGEVVKLESENGSPFYIRAVSTGMPDIFVSPSALTKGPLVINENMYDSFQLSAYQYTGTWSNSLTPNYIYNETFTKDLTSGNYNPADGARYYWPGSGYNMRFFAHAPNLDTSVLSISSQEQQGPVILTYTTPESIGDHKDLLVAVSDEVPGDYKRPVPLNFKHALTALRVVAKDMRPGVVKSITIKCVFPKGRYDMLKNAWISFSRDEMRLYSKSVHTLDLNVTITGEKNQPITDENNMMFFIPQILPLNDAAEMIIVYQPHGGQEQILVAPLRAVTKEWKMGQLITFCISTNDKIDIGINLGDFGDGGDL